MSAKIPTGSGYAKVTSGKWAGSATTLVDLASEVTGVLPAANGGGGWVTAMDLDFTAESSQTLTSNGTYTIGGKTWTKGNSSGDATAMAVTNGQGLVITPASSTDYNGSTFSLPFVHMTLSQIITNIEPGMALRLLVYVSSSNEGGTYDSTVYGFNTTSTTGYCGKRGYQANTNQGLTSFLNYNGANKGFVDNDRTIGAANNVGIIMVPHFGMSIFQHACGQYSSGFPTPANRVNLTTYVKATSDLGDSRLLDTSTIGIFLGAQRAGSGTSYVSTIARVRVDYRA